MSNDGVFHSALWFTQRQGRIDICGDGGAFAYERKSRPPIVPPNKSGPERGCAFCIIIGSAMLN
jgi:hypothetical protein